MLDSETLLPKWQKATSELPYGVQKAFITALGLVNDGLKEDLVWGADYNNGPCLVNSVANMLAVGGGHGVPSTNFGEVVGLYDQLNRFFRDKDINTNQYVSPLAAEILLQWFAPVKQVTTEAHTEAFAKGEVYVEPSDEEIEEALLTMLSRAPDYVETSFDRTDENADK